jgi:hypothetical protein
MWKHLLAAVAFTVAVTGPLAAGTESQSPAVQDNLTAVVSPLYAKPGQIMTVTAIDPCPLPAGKVMYVFWSLGPGALSGSSPVGPAGKWIVHFPAPISVGTTPLFAHCAFTASSPAVAQYEQLEFTVVARPRPNYTG